MQSPINTLVRLTQGVPDLELSPGELGIVRSVWFAPEATYEVEFVSPGMWCGLRTLLDSEQIEFVERQVQPLVA